MGKKKEEKLQISVCKYLKLQYPNIIFASDGSGVRLTKGQAVLAKKMRSDKGYPDLFIAEPRGAFSGLYLELKKDGEVVYNRNGSIRKDKQEQNEMLIRLREKGYVAEFAVGFDACKRLIDSYLG